LVLLYSLINHISHTHHTKNTNHTRHTNRTSHQITRIFLFAMIQISKFSAYL